MGQLHVGTSGWSYKHWVGPFYPQGLQPRAFLEHYARHFACVELNATFYRLPAAKTVEGWAQRTPQGFLFCPKLSRLITHQKRLMGVEDLLAGFVDRLQSLHDKLGPVLIQLPPSLTFEEPTAGAFLKLLSDVAPGQPFAVEARHLSWTESKALKLLADHNTAWVIADSGGRFPSCEATTADFVYLRLHGPEELYASSYGDRQLTAYADKAAGWLAEGHDVWAMFNNDFEGYAVENAQRLRDLVHDRAS